jgi:hypothetical protein
VPISCHDAQVEKREDTLYQFSDVEFAHLRNRSGASAKVDQHLHNCVFAPVDAQHDLWGVVVRFVFD